MRSPWVVGLALLVWLIASAILMASVVETLALFCLGAALAALLASHWNPQPSRLGSASKAVDVSEGPDQIDEGTSSPEQSESPKRSSKTTVLTLEELSELLRIDINKVTDALEMGQLPGNRVGNSWRCSLESVLQWLDGDWSKS